MSEFLEKLDERIATLKKIVATKEKELLSAPEGALHVSKTGNRIQYYLKQESLEKKKRYLKNSEEQVIKKLCQKDYDQKVLQAAQKELYQLKRLRNSYPEQLCDDIYETLSIHRQKHVQPIVLPDEEFVAQWEQSEYIKKGFADNAPEYYTDKDERVRSKSEIMIANALHKHNIPYKYEAPFYLSGYGTVYPDFTVLNVRLRKEFLWEHLGMMDDAMYVDKALKKIDTYAKNNIFPGEKLVLTHETSFRPISTRIIDRMIECYCI